jgi:hypothetical protein
MRLRVAERDQIDRDGLVSDRVELRLTGARNTLAFGNPTSLLPVARLAEPRNVKIEGSALGTVLLLPHTPSAGRYRIGGHGSETFLPKGR